MATLYTFDKSHHQVSSKEFDGSIMEARILILQNHHDHIPCTYIIHIEGDRYYILKGPIVPHLLETQSQWKRIAYKHLPKALKAYILINQ